MASSSSSHKIHANQTYQRWLADTFDGHETTNHRDRDPNCTNTFNDPFIGMEFDSAEDAREFYEIYGRQTGFTIRNNRTRRSLKDNSIIGREFVCSKQGFPAGNRSNTNGREGCNAMLKISAKKDANTKWIVYGFVKVHNHQLIHRSSEMPPRRSHRMAFSEDERDLKIRQLSSELHRERKMSEAYKEQLGVILQYVDEHVNGLSLKVEVVFDNIGKLESEE